MKTHRLNRIGSIDWQATGMCATAYYLSLMAGVSPTTFVLFVALGLGLWHNGLGALVRRLHADRGGSWAPWCGWRRYWVLTRPVLLWPLFLLGVWAFGALVLGL